MRDANRLTPTEDRENIVFLDQDSYGDSVRVSTYEGKWWVEISESRPVTLNRGQIKELRAALKASLRVTKKADSK